MKIKLIVSATAIALVAAVGSASAADRYFTLDGVTAEPLSLTEAGAVTGGVFIVFTVPIANRLPITNGLNKASVGNPNIVDFSIGVNGSTPFSITFNVVP